MNILAIDPGTTESGVCLYSSKDHKILFSDVRDNERLLENIVSWDHDIFPVDVVCIEMIASYGMPVGKDIFETCVYIGRLMQACQSVLMPVDRVYRRDVKMHLCRSMQANDASIRRAIIHAFPPEGDGKTPEIGTKEKPGPLFGVRTHIWAALGVALTYNNQVKCGKIGGML